MAYKHVKDLSEEQRRSAFLLDASLFASITVEKDDPKYRYDYSRELVRRLESGKVPKYNVVLEDLHNLLIKMLDLKEQSRIRRMFSWIDAFKRNDHAVLYEVPRMLESTKDMVGKHLKEYRIGGSRRLLTTASIVYDIPTIVTDSVEFKGIQTKLQHLYDKIHGYGAAKVRILSAPEYFYMLKSSGLRI